MRCTPATAATVGWIKWSFPKLREQTIRKAAFARSELAELGSLVTLCWRKWDSNSRSPQKAEPSVGTTTGRLLVPAHFAVYRRIGKGDQEAGAISMESLQQQSRSLQIGSVQPFREPAINRSKHIPRRRRVSVLVPVARQRNGGTQFPKPGMLL